MCFNQDAYFFGSFLTDFLQQNRQNGERKRRTDIHRKNLLLSIFLLILILMSVIFLVLSIVTILLDMSDEKLWKKEISILLKHYQSTIVNENQSIRKRRFGIIFLLWKLQGRSKYDLTIYILFSNWRKITAAACEELFAMHSVTPVGDHSFNTLMWSQSEPRRCASTAIKRLSLQTDRFIVVPWVAR